MVISLINSQLITRNLNTLLSIIKVNPLPESIRSGIQMNYSDWTIVLTASGTFPLLNFLLSRPLNLITLRSWSTLQSISSWAMFHYINKNRIICAEKFTTSKTPIRPNGPRTVQLLTTNYLMMPTMLLLPLVPPYIHQLSISTPYGPL